MAAILPKGNGDFGFTKPRNNAESAARDKKLPLQLSRQGKRNSSEGKHCTEACCDLFNVSTDFRDSGLKVLEGEKGTGRRKKCWKEEGESSLFLPNIMFSWNKTTINTDFEGHYFLTANHLQEP